MKCIVTLVLVAALAAAVQAADERVPNASTDLGPFGVGSCYINNRSAQDNARWLPQMEAIGLKYYRACHTDWGALESEQGKWNWADLDKQMDYLEGHHFKFGAILHGIARWNTKDKRGTLPVNNLPAWSMYVSEVVKHARGRIKYWEVWNEPPNFTGRDQTPADYAKIVIASYDAAKAADPECRVGLAAKSAHVNYLQQVIQAGAKDHFDYVTLHPYEILNGVAKNTGNEAVFMHIVPNVRKMLAALDPAKMNVPVIFTELGCDAKMLGAETQANALIKAYTMSIAQGVACVHWFEGMDGDSGPMGLLQKNGTLRPSCTALAQLIQHLGQQPVYLGWVLLNRKHYGFVFQGAKATVLIAWAYQGRTDQVIFGRSVQQVNPLTGAVSNADNCTLTAAPVFVVDVPTDLLKQAEANKVRPLPWGGDYANAKFVSITMGEQYAENGLHTLAGDAVAAAVVAYGGSSRAGNIPNGNLFVVDPGFLDYATAPIEITAVVRRNAANDNAGFKLVYESGKGFKTAGTWYTIPDNKQWHTVRWKINDAQFVNYWGYNFALESDGNTFNKYFIQSVTVTKLPQ